MTSAHDLYKGTARGKRRGKTNGESSQQPAKKSRVEVPFVPSPVEEPVAGSTSKDTRKEVFDRVLKMTMERVESVHQNKKYIKASSSFPGYNFGQAFSRAANDITMVPFCFVYLP